MFAIWKIEKKQINTVRDLFFNQNLESAETWMEIVSNLATTTNNRFNKEKLKIIRVSLSKQPAEIVLHLSYGSSVFLPIRCKITQSRKSTAAFVALRAVSAIMNIIEQK